MDASWSEPERPNGVVLGYSVVLERYVGGVVGTVDVDGNTLTASFSGTQDNPIGTLCVGDEPGAHNDIVHSMSLCIPE